MNLKRSLQTAGLFFALSVFALPAALAAQAPEGTQRYTDVAPGDVFYDNVAALTDMGIAKGFSDGRFGVTEPMSEGQLMIFAARVRSMALLGDAEAGAKAFSGEETADAYAQYLLSEGVIEEAPALFSAKATRAYTAHVLARLLPLDTMEAIAGKTVDRAIASGKFITDVNTETPWAEDIYNLYRCGISVGSDAFGSYLPDATLTRGAAAALLTRLTDPSLRIAPDWDISAAVSAAGTTYADLVPDAETFYIAPMTDEEMESDILLMLADDSDTLTLQYDYLSDEGAHARLLQALKVLKSYAEQGYNAGASEYSDEGDLQIVFTAVAADDKVQLYRTEALEAAISVHDQLWNKGLITAQMSEREKAWVYYDWICRNCVYDYAAGDYSLSHIPYSLFSLGRAVCDGYTGALNLFLRLENIACTAISSESHMWCVAELDGEIVHIDATWGDRDGDEPDPYYFAMTPEMAWREHRW